MVCEEREVKVLVVTTEKDPLCNQNINNLFEVSKSVHMNRHRWMVRDQGHSHAY